MSRTSLVLASLVPCLAGMCLVGVSAIFFLNHVNPGKVMFLMLGVMSLLMGAVITLSPALAWVFGPPGAPRPPKAAKEADKAEALADDEVDAIVASSAEIVADESLVSDSEMAVNEDDYLDADALDEDPKMGSSVVIGEEGADVLSSSELATSGSGGSDALGGSDIDLGGPGAAGDSDVSSGSSASAQSLDFVQDDSIDFLLDDDKEDKDDK